MKYELKHYAYRPTIGGKSVPYGDKIINDLEKDAINYIGTFSEYNPIGLQQSMAVYIKKETTSSINQQIPFKLLGFRLQLGLGYHGSKFNNNRAIKFSKQELLRIAHAMDETDSLQIAIPDYLDREQFMSDIEIVTGQKQ